MENEIIATIEKLFEQIQKTISANNKMTLYNSARYLEDLMVEILNAIYGWNLKNKNKEAINAAYIDLCDDIRHIRVQVTTQQKENLKEKISKTMSCATQKYGNDKIYFFSLFGYPDSVHLLLTKHFDEERMLDVPKLVQCLRLCDTETQNFVCQKLLQAKDSQCFSLSPTELYNPDLEKEYSLVSDERMVCFAHGMGRVRVTAYIPKITGENFGCVIEFGRYSIEDAFVSFNEEEAITNIFEFKNVDLEERKIVAQISRERDWVAVQLGNVRLFLDVNTTEQLCTLLDEVQEIYLNLKAVILKVIGAERYKVDSIYKPHIFFCQISNELWRKICELADECGDCEENREWGKFIPYYSSWETKELRITNDYGRSIACIIDRTPIPDREYCDLYWAPGYAGHDVFEMGYKEGVLWGVETTYNWLTEELIPYIENRSADNLDIIPFSLPRLWNIIKKCIGLNDGR